MAQDGKATWRERKAKQGVRRVAAERLSTPEQLDQVIQVVRLPHWLYLAALLLVLVVGVALSVLVEVPVTVRGEGILINVGGILTVTSQAEGRLEDLYVALGSVVSEGQRVAVIEQPDLLQALGDLGDELAEARKRERRIREFQQRTSKAEGETLDNRRRALEQSREFARQHRDLLREQVAAERDLHEQGILSLFQLKATETRLNEAEDELLAVINELAALDEVVESRRLTHERELLELSQEILDLERREVSLRNAYRRETEVTSPYAGQVVELKVNPGEIVERNGPLFSLLPLAGQGHLAGGAATHSTVVGLAPPRTETAPSVAAGSSRHESDLVAVLYVPPADGKKIREGMEVQLELSSHKREEFGFMLGDVLTVAEVPSTAEGMMRILKNRQLVDQLSQAHAPFEIHVELRTDSSNRSGYAWSSSSGPEVAINVGTLCIGDVITDRKRPLALLLPAFARRIQDRRQAMRARQGTPEGG